MTAPPLSTLNLNLFLTLDALLETRSLRRAAERTGVTQSALSHSLRQLREVFGDPLLVRVGNRMLATPRAEQLAGPLRQAMLALRRVVEHEGAFDAKRSARRFVVATSDALAVTLFPAVFSRIRTSAPGVEVALVPLDAQTMEAGLASGEIDVSVGPSKARAGLESAVLFESEFVVLARAGHPGIERRLDLETFCRLPHAIVSAPGRGTGAVDDALAKVGRSRRVMLRAPYFLAAPALVAETDVLLTVPRFVGEHFAERYGLAVYPPPIELPRGVIRMLWHERFASDPGVGWLSRCLTESVAAERLAADRPQASPARRSNRR